MLSTALMRGRLVSGEPLVVFGDDLRVVTWNAAAEKFTGVPADEAVGREVWDVLPTTDVSGGPACVEGCPTALHALGGRPKSAERVVVHTRFGPRPADVTTLALDDQDGRYVCRILHPRAQETLDAAAAVSLTPRQHHVLSLLAEGFTAKLIAQRLAIREPTVRNHIRALLLELRAHSQLEAVARARHLGLV